MSETRADRPFRVFLAALTCYALFALMNVFVKLVSDTQPVAQIIFFRNALGLLPVLIVTLRTHGRDSFRTAHPAGHFLRSFIGTVSMVFYFLSFARLPLANATAIQATSPLLQTLMSIPFLGEKVGPHRLTAVAIGLCAVLFMLQPTHGGNLNDSMIALAAAVSGAAVMVIIRRLGRTEKSLTIVFYFMVFGALSSGLLLPLFWVTPPPLVLLYLILIGLLGGAAQIFMTWAYANGPTAFVSSFSYISIVFAALADWLVWEHRIDWHIAVGSLIVIATGLYVLYRETLHKRAALEAITINE